MSITKEKKEFEEIVILLIINVCLVFEISFFLIVQNRNMKLIIIIFSLKKTTNFLRIYIRPSQCDQGLWDGIDHFLNKKSRIRLTTPCCNSRTQLKSIFIDESLLSSLRSIYKTKTLQVINFFLASIFRERIDLLLMQLLSWICYLVIPKTLAEETMKKCLSIIQSIISILRRKDRHLV